MKREPFEKYAIGHAYHERTTYGFTVQRWLQGNFPPNLAGSAAAFGGFLPSMPRSLPWSLPASAPILLNRLPVHHATTQPSLGTRNSPPSETGRDPSCSSKTMGTFDCTTLTMAPRGLGGTVPLDFLSARERALSDLASSATTSWWFERPTVGALNWEYKCDDDRNIARRSSASLELAFNSSLQQAIRRPENMAAALKIGQHVKPDNILVNYGDGTNRFSEVELGDCADAYSVDPNADPFEEGHVIGAAIFRSPEANLQLRWGTATDIWSFGATLISLIWGQDWHIFIPEGYSVDDPDYPTQVLAKQASIFGPFPHSYIDIADEERQGILAVINNYINENGLRKPFSMAEDPELTVEDRNFICKIMRMDPRDRPTAKQLLEDPWFN
ncbi:hypothetical protein CIB48_g10732 [Xylaria polymorpha]|nr:hypothetical protein CIB48_g10732 [Xylaria polymorpha]